jgi:hypothetical protein
MGDADIAGMTYVDTGELFRGCISSMTAVSYYRFGGPCIDDCTIFHRTYYASRPAIVPAFFVGFQVGRSGIN